MPTSRAKSSGFKKPAVTVILFILSLIFIVTAYCMVLKNGITSFDNRLIIELILGAVGTFFVLCVAVRIPPEAHKSEQKALSQGPQHVHTAADKQPHKHSTYLDIVHLPYALFHHRNFLDRHRHDKRA